MKASFLRSKVSTVKTQILWAVRVLATVVLLVSTGSALEASTVTVMWDRNAEPDVSGYIISYGTQSGTYTTSLDVGNVTSSPLDLADGQRYYVVVQAYNTSSQLSGRSTEVMVDMTTPAGPSLTNLSPASGTVGAAVTISGTNFGSSQGTSTVTFNGTAASPTSWSAGSIVVPVPGGATTGNVVVTVGGASSNGLTFTVTTSGLPAPWVSQDVGNPAIAGQATYASGVFTVTGSGANIFGTNDEFRFVYQTIDGDGQVVARVDSVQKADAWTKAGVMIREDLAGNAPNAMAALTSTNGLMFQSRASRGGTSTSSTGIAGAAPQWIRLVRSGNTFTGYYSATGTSWTLLGSVTVPMAVHVYVGLAVTSHNPGVTATHKFSSVTVTGGVGSPNQPPTLTQPANQMNVEGANVSLQLSASDPDGNPLTYSASGLPPSLGVNASTGLISGTLPYTSAGSYSVTATASDGTLSNSKTFTWTVSNTNQAPTLAQPANQTSVEGASASLQLTASDPDGTALTYSATGLPAGLGVNTTTGLISGTLSTPSAGTYNVTATASDGTLTNSKTFTWTVTTASQAPSLSSLSPTSGTVGTVVTISGANFGSPQGTSTVTFNGTPASPTTWGASSIVVPVPGGATTGNVVVRVGGVASNGLPFTVTTSGTSYVLDSFTGADGTSLASHTPDTGGAWVADVAGAKLLGNRLEGVNFGSTRSHNTTRPASADYEVAVDVTVNGSGSGSRGGVQGRMQADMSGSGSAKYEAYFNEGTHTWYLDKWTGGNPARLGTFADASFTSGTKRLKLGMVGTTITVSVNSTAVITVTDSSVRLVGFAGIYLEGGIHNGILLDNYAVADIGASGGAMTPPASGAQASAANVVDPAARVTRATLNDYDGDGQSDMAAYRPSTGAWQVLASGTGFTTGTAARWGTATDLAVPGDYDGDRKADMAYYRPSTGEWSILLSGTNFKVHRDVSLGGGDADVPVPGDYDGDGMTDAAIYSPAVGQWWILTSSSGYTAVKVIAWGTALDVPVPGDYDGDGKTDVAVYRPSTGEWKILGSRTGYATDVTLVLGSGTDTPVAGDYDGDGRADVAVFHDGTWQVLYSGADYASGMSVSWGRRTDVPVSKRP